MTTTEREDYFAWLCSKVEVPEGKDYTTIFELMYIKEFVWIIGNDDNRQQDARDLRIQFGGQNAELRRKVDWSQKVYGDAVSVLEVLIGVSERLSFLIDEPAPVCARKLIENMGLDRHRNNIHKIEDILHAFVWRTYRHNGSGGGFFPLKHPSRDQTSVEIWYQMAEWIEENYDL